MLPGSFTSTLRCNIPLTTICWKALRLSCSALTSHCGNRMLSWGLLFHAHTTCHSPAPTPHITLAKQVLQAFQVEGGGVVCRKSREPLPPQTGLRKTDPRGSLRAVTSAARQRQVAPPLVGGARG
ncbi:Hypothetical predicted protein [Podarcis lilfordi]|uniref:Uncharacterized protein n=1 Tax=Podarcis lilfordi TaxID=74358 RepID=A0AA35KDN6_9SAUR|nr:Hypothetical predicted protein [Podarcis lilfordi]